METVVTQPSVRLDPAVAPAAAEQFAAAYASWPADRRRDADAVLDALERSTASTGFSELDAIDAARSCAPAPP
jgi:phytoene dehydrogenase-like protein